MRKSICHISAKLIALIMIGVILILSGCAASPDEGQGEGFAIYLTKEDIPPARMEPLSHVNLAEQPILSMADIITYNAQTHEMELTANAFERISQLVEQLNTISFVVCVDREPIYWGAFWPMISSASFEGVTIMTPPFQKETHIITLEPGYASPSFYEKEDPRGDPEIMKALDEAGKLVNKPPTSEIDELPYSMKGYELYSWLDYGEWHFTLITGTNRTKTVAEIASTDNTISESGWVHIHVIGNYAIESVLCKLPHGEEVSWLAESWSGQTPPDNITLTLPPEATVNSIRACAEQCGISLHYD